METILLVLLGLLAGAGLPLQAGINSAMRTYAGGPIWAALVNFVVGGVGLALFLLLQRSPVPSLGALGRAPWWSWTGGLLGAVFVSSAVVLTPRLGVAVTLSLIVGGQMAGALLLDRLGAFGVVARELTAGRLLGAALVVAGVVLLQR